jgi:hypothetical protein
MPIIPGLRRQRQDDFKFKVSLGYVVRLAQNKKQKKRKKRKTPKSNFIAKYPF